MDANGTGGRRCCHEGMLQDIALKTSKKGPAEDSTWRVKVIDGEAGPEQKLADGTEDGGGASRTKE